MLRKKKLKKNVDPIADKLKSPNPKLEEKARKMRRGPNSPLNTLQDRNARWVDQHELAEYETIEYIDDTDSKVQDFLRYLGLQPEMLEKVTISVEVGKPVKVGTTGFSQGNRFNGSPWRYPK